MMAKDKLAEIRRRYRRRMAWCRQHGGDMPISFAEICKTDDNSRFDIGHLLRCINDLRRRLVKTEKAKGE